MAEQTETEALKAQLATLRAFLAEHPEVAAELGVPDAAPAGPPVPLTFHGVVHELVDRLHGADQERRDQMHAVIEDHAVQHAALIAGHDTPEAAESHADAAPAPDLPGGEHPPA